MRPTIRVSGAGPPAGRRGQPEAAPSEPLPATRNFSLRVTPDAAVTGLWRHGPPAVPGAGPPVPSRGGGCAGPVASLSPAGPGPGGAAPPARLPVTRRPQPGPGVTSLDDIALRQVYGTVTDDDYTACPVRLRLGKGSDNVTQRRASDSAGPEWPQVPVTE